MDQRPSEPWGSQVGHRERVGRTAERMAARTEHLKVAEEAAEQAAGFAEPGLQVRG